MLVEYSMLRFSLVILVSSLLTTTSIAEDSNLPYEQQENVVYHQAHGVALVADIFTPRKSPNGRAIVVVASGGWSSDRGKIRDLNRAGLFEELCGRGFHVFAIRPGSISRFSAHDMKAHVEAGIRWVKSHANDYSIDPNTLGLFGASAGGHLASLAAVTNPPGDSRSDASVSAVGVFFPPTDFLNFGGQALDPRKDGRFNQILENLAFRDSDGDLTDLQVREQSKAISPARLVTKQAPPFLVVHGDSDPVVPLQQSQALVAALKESEVPARLIIKEGGAHPWPTIREEMIVMADWFLNTLQQP
jgi:acetyl esterase/lipase